MSDTGGIFIRLLEQVKVFGEVPVDGHIKVITGPNFAKLTQMMYLMIPMYLNLSLRFWMLE